MSEYLCISILFDIERKEEKGAAHACEIVTDPHDDAVAIPQV